MGELRVITVPPEYLPAADREDGYAVILGDCVLPGHYLGRYLDANAADTACRYFAEHYGLKGYPVDHPGARRAQFTIIVGGKAFGESKRSL